MRNTSSLGSVFGQRSTSLTSAARTDTYLFEHTDTQQTAGRQTRKRQTGGEKDSHLIGSGVQMLLNASPFSTGTHIHRQSVLSGVL